MAARRCPRRLDPMLAAWVNTYAVAFATSAASTVAMSFASVALIHPSGTSVLPHAQAQSSLTTLSQRHSGTGPGEKNRGRSEEWPLGVDCHRG